MINVVNILDGKNIDNIDCRDIYENTVYMMYCVVEYVVECVSMIYVDVDNMTVMMMIEI